MFAEFSLEVRWVFVLLSLDIRWIILGLSLSFDVHGLLRWMFIGIPLAPMDPPWISIGFSLGSRLIFIILIGISFDFRLTFLGFAV